MEAKGPTPSTARTKTGSMKCCLICCSVAESDADVNFNNSKLAKATKKIFEYLIIPQKDFIKLRKNKCELNFCSKCSAFVKDIVELQDKIEILELNIKWNAEVLGRIAMQTPTVPIFGKANNNRKSMLEIWNIFKAPVTKNYIQGILPNPSVKLIKGVDLKTKEGVRSRSGKVGEKLNSSIGIGNTKNQEKYRKKQSDSNDSLREAEDENQLLNELLPEVESQKHSYYCIEEEIKPEVDFNEAGVEVPPIIVEIKEDLTEYFEDSDDDLFEAILVPKKRATEDNQKKVKKYDTETEGLGDQGSNVLNEGNLTKMKEREDNEIILEVDGNAKFSKTAEEEHPEYQIENFQNSDNNHLFEVVLSPSETEQGKLEESNIRSDIDVSEESRDSIVCVEENDETETELNGATDQNDDLQLQLTEDPLRLHSTQHKTIENPNDVEILYVRRSIPDVAISTTTNCEKINKLPSPRVTQNEISKLPTSIDILNTNRTMTEDIGGTQNLVEKNDAATPHAVRVRSKESPQTANERPMEDVATVGKRYRPTRAAAPKSFKQVVEVSDEESLSDSDSKSGCTDDGSDSEFEINSGSDNDSDYESAQKTQIENNNVGIKDSGKRTIDNSNETNARKRDTVEEANVNGSLSLSVQEKNANGSLTVQKPNVNESLTTVQETDSNKSLSVQQTTVNESITVQETNANGSLTVQETNVNLSETVEERLLKKCVSLLSFRNVEPNRKLEELTEGKDYMKCTKCDFVCKKNKHKFYNRGSVGAHYNLAHNPVKASNIDKTSDGKPCYKCTKCNFFIVCSSSYQSARLKLSLHYMELHDAFENMIARLNKNSETQEKLQNLSPIEGLDYFLCPYPTCGYVVLIEKVTDKRIQCENGARARMNIIEHFRRSYTHVKDRKEILPDTSQFKNNDENTRHFKCTKCDEKLQFPDELTDHFIREHIFPWDTFPGLYKYNCYEEESKDGDILKCLVRGCDYLQKIGNPLDDESREECLLKAYNLFSAKHGSKHNLNSVEYTLKVQPKVPAKSYSLGLKDGNSESGGDEGSDGEFEINSGSETESDSESRQKTPTVQNNELKDSVKNNMDHSSETIVNESLTVQETNVKKSHAVQETNVNVNGRGTVQETNANLSDSVHEALVKKYVSLLSFRNVEPEESVTKTEELSEGRDYMKCTKCDFVCKKIKHRSYNRVSVASHYNLAHNPVKASNIDKTSDGKPCYKCTKCNFFIACSSSYRSARCKLSLHYMELHDAFENMIARFNKTSEIQEKLQNLSPIEGLDYFLCPYPTCGYVVLIEKVTDKRIQCENGARARMNIIEHFRRSSSHVKDRKENLPDTLAQFKDTDESTSYFKCTKCDEKLQSANELTDHFIREHIFPWDTFPGLYKYNCYEEESKDGDVLKCLVRGCDYLQKIGNPLDDESREECRLKAYNLFSTKHASKHNLNSVEYEVWKHPKVPSKSCPSALKGNDGVATECIEIPNSDGENEEKEKERVKRKQPVDICSTRNKKVKNSNFPNCINSNPESEKSNCNEELDSGSESDSNSVCDEDKGAEAVFTTPKRCKKYLAKFFRHGSNIPIPVGLTEGKDYSKCPQCNYFFLFSRSSSKKFECAKNYAKQKIAIHYAMHNPVKLNDISKTANGEDCYRCTKCSFAVIIDESRLDKNRPEEWTKNELLRKLSVHYLALHEPQFANEPTATDQLTDLVEAVDYYRCPEEKCNYFVLLSNFKNNKKRFLDGRRNIIRHYNKFHNPELEAVVSKPVLDEADGTECFKCPKCDFKSVVKKFSDGKSISLLETSARRKFRKHFTKEHVTPWQNFPGLYPFKCREEKLGEDDIVRCDYSPSECDYFVKIKYIEGKSVAKCRYSAYNAVRVHYWFHDPKHKHRLDKGYTSILPLYKGNQKIIHPRFNSNINMANTASTDSVTDGVKSTDATNTVIANDAGSETTDAVVSSQPSAVKKPIQVDDENNSFHSGSFSNLRRSKRTSTVKRKRYDQDDYFANEMNCDKDSNMDEESYRCRDKIVQDSLNGGNETDNNTSLDHDDGQLATAKTSPEFVYNTDKDHYRCWKCNYYSEVVYSDKRIVTSSQQVARQRLSIHFNSTHCIEELKFRDPDKLLIVVDEKKFFKCPRCDHREEIIFNPKKHADRIQGRKNARVNLGQHFFFAHCVPESLIGTNQECGVSDPNKKDVVSEQLPIESVAGEGPTDANTIVLETGGVAISEKLPEPVGTLEKVSDGSHEEESAKLIAHPADSISLTNA